jgi:TolA-binding protein
LAAKVNGNGKTKWIVEAGPYTVKVLGTEFQVSWDADTERLNVSVSSGHVSVSGANLGEKGVVLEPGLRLVSDRSGSQISRKTGTAENTEAAPRTGEIGATPALSSVSKIEEVRNPMASMSDTKDEPRAQSTQKTVSTRAIAHLSKSVWRTAVDAEEWATAIDAMDSNAVAEAAAEAESGVLWRLAEEARRLRRTDLSDIFFEAVRTKSQGTDRAATAAFLLGKSAWDMRGDPKTAKKWLDIYLAESPNGTLAEEARGRLMEVNRYMENQDEARRIAIDYLRRYPNGSFAGQAKRIQEHPY